MGDVSSEEDVKRMFEEVVEQLGALDVVSSCDHITYVGY